MRFSAARAALVALLALAGCSRDPVGDRPDYVATASGRLDARVEARFLAAERDGCIEALLVRPGAKVAAGQPLLTISCGDVAAQADAARAQARASDADARLSDEGPRREAVEAGAARAAEAATRRADAADELRRAEGMQASGYVSVRRLTQLRASLAEATAKAASPTPNTPRSRPARVSMNAPLHVRVPRPRPRAPTRSTRRSEKVHACARRSTAACSRCCAARASFRAPPPARRWWWSATSAR